MQYVRDTYGVPVRRGQRVRARIGQLAGEIMIVTRCTHYVHAHPQHGKYQWGYCGLLPAYVQRFHPLDLEYETKDGWYEP